MWLKRHTARVCLTGQMDKELSARVTAAPSMADNLRSRDVTSTKHGIQTKSYCCCDSSRLVDSVVGWIMKMDENHV